MMLNAVKSRPPSGKSIIKMIVILTIMLTSMNLPAQELQWAHSFGADGWDEGIWVDFDSQGNIYIVGLFYGTVDFDPSANTANLISNGGADIFFASYEQNGDYRWAFNIGGTNGDVGLSVAVYNSYIYITGYFQNTADFDPSVNISDLTSAGSADIFVACYDSNGNYQWAHSFGSTAWDSGNSITTDDNGNPLVTGSFYGTVDFDPFVNDASLTENGGSDIFIAKYDANGNYIWAINPGGSLVDRGNGITSDNNGNVYVIGNFMGTIDADPTANTANLTSNGLNDVSVLSYNPSGNYRWGFHAGGSGSDIGWSITHQTNDMGDMIFTTGQFELSADFDPSVNENILTSNGALDIFIGSYGTNGNHNWAYEIGGPNSDGGYSIDAEQNDYVYVTGWYGGGGCDFDPASGDIVSFPGIGNGDTFLAKYRFDGKYDFAQVVGGPGMDFGNGVAAHNPVYVVGEFEGTVDLDASPSTASFTSNGQADIFIAKYSRTPLTVDEIMEIPEAFNLAQNYPNPFNPETTISYELPLRTFVQIDIIDLQGKIVNTILDDYKEPGIHIINWNGRDNKDNKVGTGIYFYQIKSDVFSETKKMVLLR